jgi:hypothetical protein
MRARQLPFVLVFACTLLPAGGCGYVAPEVQVQGPVQDLDRLAGEWQGEYVGDPAHGRRGSISFKLVAGEGHAHGDVLMIPAGQTAPYGRRPGRVDADTPPVERTERAPDPILTIRLVLANGRTVTGVLDPYWDPDRSTEATTTFQGVLTDDTIQGTFTTAYASGAARTAGTWTVKRRR